MRKLKRISENIFTYQENILPKTKEDLKTEVRVFFLEPSINKFIKVGRIIDVTETKFEYSKKENKRIITLKEENENVYIHYELIVDKVSSDIEEIYQVKSNFESYETRVIEEEIELTNNILKLKKFLHSTQSDYLELEALELLEKQLKIMEDYREILNERIELFIKKQSLNKVRCLKSTEKGEVTKDYIYDVIEKSDDSYTVYNNSGYPQSLDKEYFEEI